MTRPEGSLKEMPDEEIANYRSVLTAAMCIATSRPDASFALFAAAEGNPGLKERSEALRVDQIIEYLRETSDCGAIFPRYSEPKQK